MIIPVKKTSHSITIMVVYVDDIILTGDDPSLIQQLKQHLHQVFNIKDLGTLSYFFGIEVFYVPQGIILSQKKFSSELIQDYDLTLFKRAVTSLTVNFKFQQSYSPPFSDPTSYRSLVGKLNFLTHTRLDLSNSIQTFSQYMQNPTELHFQALTHTLSYVAQTAGQGILLNGFDQLHL